MGGWIKGNIDEVDDNVALKKLTALQEVVDNEIKKILLKKRSLEDNTYGEERLKWLKRYKRYFLFRQRRLQILLHGKYDEELKLDFFNNFKIDAFDQRSLGCLGYMQDQEVYFYTQTSKIHTIKSRFNKRIDSIKSVAIAFYYSGADAKILYDLASDHEGIVIAGSGSGNYSQAWLKAIEELSEKGTIFVRSSRISQGIVFDDEIFDPHHLCISSNTLSPQKARVLLMLALTQTHDRDEIREIFLQY